MNGVVGVGRVRDLPRSGNSGPRHALQGYRWSATCPENTVHVTLED